MQKLDFAAEHERGAGQGQARGAKAGGFAPWTPSKGRAFAIHPLSRPQVEGSRAAPLAGFSAEP